MAFAILRVRFLVSTTDRLILHNATSYTCVTEERRSVQTTGRFSSGVTHSTGLVTSIAIDVTCLRPQHHSGDQRMARRRNPPCYTRTARREQNRKLLKSLGHASSASAIAEIRAHLPWIDLANTYPRVNGKKISIVVLLRYARGDLSLTLDYPYDPRSIARRQRNAELLRRLFSDKGTYAPNYSICG